MVTFLSYTFSLKWNITSEKYDYWNIRAHYVRNVLPRHIIFNQHQVQFFAIDSSNLQLPFLVPSWPRVGRNRKLFGSRNYLEATACISFFFLFLFMLLMEITVRRRRVFLFYDSEWYVLTDLNIYLKYHSGVRKQATSTGFFVYLSVRRLVHRAPCSSLEYIFLSPFIKLIFETMIMSGFRCVCEAGFTGSFCELELDPCQSAPCLNLGICRPVGGASYQCTCQPGYEGLHCQVLQLITLLCFIRKEVLR